jgi:hypothetical protein
MRSCGTWRFWREFVQKKGHALPASRARFRGRDLGAWVVDQRVRKHDGRLPSRRARRLESVPGWSWAPRDDAFQAAVAQLRVFATKHGHTRVPPKYQGAGGGSAGGGAAALAGLIRVAAPVPRLVVVVEAVAAPTATTKFT